MSTIEDLPKTLEQLQREHADHLRDSAAKIRQMEIDHARELATRQILAAVSSFVSKGWSAEEIEKYYIQPEIEFLNMSASINGEKQS